MTNKEAIEVLKTRKIFLRTDSEEFMAIDKAILALEKDKADREFTMALLGGFK